MSKTYEDTFWGYKYRIVIADDYRSAKWKMSKTSDHPIINAVDRYPAIQRLFSQEGCKEHVRRSVKFFAALAKFEEVYYPRRHKLYKQHFAMTDKQLDKHWDVLDMILNGIEYDYLDEEWKTKVFEVQAALGAYFDESTMREWGYIK